MLPNFLPIYSPIIWASFVRCRPRAQFFQTTSLTFASDASNADKFRFIPRYLSNDLSVYKINFELPEWSVCSVADLLLPTPSIITESIKNSCSTRCQHDPASTSHSEKRSHISTLISLATNRSLVSSNLPLYLLKMERWIQLIYWHQTHLNLKFFHCKWRQFQIKLSL